MQLVILTSLFLSFSISNAASPSAEDLGEPITLDQKKHFEACKSGRKQAIAAKRSKCKQINQETGLCPDDYCLVSQFPVEYDRTYCYRDPHHFDFWLTCNYFLEPILGNTRGSTEIEICADPEILAATCEELVLGPDVVE